MKKGLAFMIIILLGSAPPASGYLSSVGLDKNLYTSDFMIGDVVVSIIFPESNGALDPNIENWDTGRQTQVLTEIMTGLNWWTKQNEKSALNFTFISQTLSTKYEPITRPYYSEALWIPDLMGKLGYSGSRFTATRSYVNDLREEHNADWGFVIFVVDSLLDSNGKLSDGYFAYAYLGGPYMVMTYDNNGYGISNMDVVVAHETGHIFHALDEYAGGSSPSAYSYGYFPTVNGNHAYSSEANNPDSIMRGGIRWELSDWTRQMIGWRDSDANGYDDIVDQSPNIGVLTNTSSNNNEAPNFVGQTNVTVLPRQGNEQGHGLTVDTIARVEYKITGSEWVEATPVDGSFDSNQETFQIVVDGSTFQGSQTVQTQDVQIRVLTNYTLSGGGGSDGTSGVLGAPGSLSNAHAYPNPFKPNSALNHSQITFTGLTPGAKVQIFTPAGEPVFEVSATSTQTQVTWAAKTDGGSNVSSGLYFYLITDDNGNTKKGKIAVIR